MVAGDAQVVVAGHANSGAAEVIEGDVERAEFGSARSDGDGGPGHERKKCVGAEVEVET